MWLTERECIKRIFKRRRYIREITNERYTHLLADKGEDNKNESIVDGGRIVVHTNYQVIPARYDPHLKDTNGDDLLSGYGASTIGAHE